MICYKLLEHPNGLALLVCCGNCEVEWLLFLC
uniref:Uncharacterized protein n=1 Tax=Rhizophora mucronata TaxID=61149 RepID=A0A2P2NCY5_RHIMU